MDPVTLQNKGISFDFSKWSLDAYQRVVSDKQIWVGFRNAVLYSIIFTIISVAVTMLAAYPMSLPDFKGKKIFNTLFVITMFFSGGLSPTYLLINNLGLLDSMWAVILPGAFSVWNMIIARTYYQGVPRELRSCGCGWSQRDALLLQDPAARLYAGGGGSGPVAVRGYVEQLL